MSSANEGIRGLPSPSFIVNHLAEIRAQEEKAINAAHAGASLAANILLESSLHGRGLSGNAEMEFSRDVMALKEVLPELQRQRAAHSLVSTPKEHLGPIEIPPGRIIEHYLGGLLIASQALEMPIVAEANDVPMRIEPHYTRSEAIHGYDAGLIALGRK